MKLRLNSGGKNEHRSYGYHDTSQLPRTAQLRLAQWLGEHEGHDRRRSRLWIIGLGGFQGLPELLPPENAPMPTMLLKPWVKKSKSLKSQSHGARTSRIVCLDPFVHS